MLRKITFRPWGWWQALFQGPGFLAKIINVKKDNNLVFSTTSIEVRLGLLHQE